MDSVVEAGEEVVRPPEKKEVVAPPSLRVMFNIINPFKKKDSGAAAAGETVANVRVNCDVKGKSGVNNGVLEEEQDSDHEDDILEGKDDLSPSPPKKVVELRAKSSRKRKVSPPPPEDFSEDVPEEEDVSRDSSKKIAFEIDNDPPEEKYSPLTVLEQSLRKPLWKLRGNSNNAEPKAKAGRGRPRKKGNGPPGYDDLFTEVVRPRRSHTPPPEEDSNPVMWPPPPPEPVEVPLPVPPPSKKKKKVVKKVMEKKSDPQPEPGPKVVLKTSMPTPRGGRKIVSEEAGRTERPTPPPPPATGWSVLPQLLPDVETTRYYPFPENVKRPQRKTSRPSLSIVPLTSLQPEDEEAEDWAMPTITSTFSVTKPKAQPPPKSYEDEDDDEICFILEKPGVPKPKSAPRPAPKAKARVQPIKPKPVVETKIEPVQTELSPAAEEEKTDKPQDEDATSATTPEPDVPLSPIPSPYTVEEEEELACGLCDGCGSFFAGVEPDEYGETIGNHVCGECLCFLCGGCFPNREIYRGHFEKETGACIPPPPRPRTPTPPPPPRIPTPPPVLTPVTKEVETFPNGDVGEGGNQLTETANKKKRSRNKIKKEDSESSPTKGKRKPRRRRGRKTEEFLSEEEETESDEEFKLSEPVKPVKGRKSKPSLPKDPTFNPVFEGEDNVSAAVEDFPDIPPEPPRRSLRARKPVQKLILEDESSNSSEEEVGPEPEPDIHPPILEPETEEPVSAPTSPPNLVLPVPASHILSKKDIIWAKKDDPAETTYSAYHKRHIDPAHGIHPVSLLRIGGCSFDDGHRQNLYLADAQILHDTSEIEGLSLILEPKQGIALKVLLEGNNLRVSYYLLRKRATYKYTDEEETPETDEDEENVEFPTGF